ncbi:Fc.00g017900.m01.CDS01 [Cosmosporella sp. VM-42]
MASNGSSATPVAALSDSARSAASASSSGHVPASSSSPETYEATHVHAVYEAIAPHFSSTRHKPWPFVSTFLNGLRPGSVGLDVGCGNGKYLPVNPALHIFGSDYSAALVRLAKTERGGDVAVADGMALPYRAASFDFVISVAVIHHLSTQERRREAILRLLECVIPVEGRVLVFVWALEQGSSRRGWDEGSEQDTLVPWVMRTKGAADETFQRYYHLYKKGELEEDVEAVGGAVLESGYERDNWWVICSRTA